MKLNYKLTVLTGLAFMSICAFWQMYDNIIPLILTNTFHMGETLTGTIMALDNVLALFLLPFFGSLSDKMGKRKPFIIGGTAVAVTAMMVLPFADQAKNLILFIIGLGVVLVAMGFYRSPAVALMPDLTPKPLRSKGNAIINLMGAIGGVYTLVMIKLLVKGGATPSYIPLFASIALLMVLCVLIMSITVKEKGIHNEEEEHTSQVDSNEKLPADVKKSLVFLLLSIFFWFTAYNAVTTAFSRYATNVWKLENGGYANCLMLATICAIISYIPIGFISSKFGRKKTILAGVALLAACYAYVFFFKEYHPSINIGFALVGVAWAAISVNSLPMVVEMCRASDVGKYTGLYYTFSMSAQIATPILSGFLLEHISYTTLFPYATFFSLAAFATMCFVKHGDSTPEIKKDILDNFDVED